MQRACCPLSIRQGSSISSRLRSAATTSARSISTTRATIAVHSLINDERVSVLRVFCEKLVRIAAPATCGAPKGCTRVQPGVPFLISQLTRAARDQSAERDGEASSLYLYEL